MHKYRQTYTDTDTHRYRQTHSTYTHTIQTDTDTHPNVCIYHIAGKFDGKKVWQTSSISPNQNLPNASIKYKSLANSKFAKLFSLQNHIIVNLPKCLSAKLSCYMTTNTCCIVTDDQKLDFYKFNIISAMLQLSKSF